MSDPIWKTFAMTTRRADRKVTLRLDVRHVVAVIESVEDLHGQSMNVATIRLNDGHEYQVIDSARHGVARSCMDQPDDGGVQ